MNPLGVPLGYAIFFIYKVISNYALSIIVFTLILRIVMVPFAIKQQKSLARTSAFQPYINEINKKYAKNFAKKNEELQKLYRDHDINPASGCLVSLLPMIILFGMIDVIYRPLTHILHLAPEVIDSAVEIFRNTSSNFPASNRMGAVQLNLISDVVSNPSNYQSLGDEVVDSIKSIDLNFLGFNIGEVASLSSITVIFPILALVFSFLQIYISFKTNSMPTNNTVNPTLKVMLFVMPFVSVFISLTIPIGVSLYWIVGYILQIIQILVLNKVCNMNELKEKAMQEFEAIRKKNKSKKKNIAVGTGTAEGEKGLELDEKDRVAQARKKLAEKYDG